MNLDVLNRICFTLCILCIVVGTVLSLGMIWGSFERENLWRVWLSNGVIFVAAALTLSVSKTLGKKGDV